MLATVSGRLAWRGRNPADTSKVRNSLENADRGVAAAPHSPPASARQWCRAASTTCSSSCCSSATAVRPPLLSAASAGLLRRAVVCLLVVAVLPTALTSSTCRRRQKLRAAPVLGRLVHDVLHHDHRVRLSDSLGSRGAISRADVFITACAVCPALISRSRPSTSMGRE